MPFFPVDDDAAFHAKLRKAGNAAVGLWARAGAYCMKEATGGVLERHELSGLGVPAEARRLVDAVLWHAVGHDCDRCPQPPSGGWVFHDWVEWGPLKTREAIKERREADRDRQRRKREKDRHAVTPAVTHDGGHGGSPRSPSPSPSLVVTTPVVLRSVPSELGDDDLTRIAEATCGDLGHARRVTADVLGRSSEPVRNPVAYVLRAIGDEPERYRPTTRNRAEDQCETHPGSLARNCAGCRSEQIAGDA